jgi:hypothetical protein
MAPLSPSHIGDDSLGNGVRVEESRILEATGVSSSQRDAPRSGVRCARIPFCSRPSRPALSRLRGLSPG